MKSKGIVPTGEERFLLPGRYIVSTTDAQGRITAVNDVFIEYCGFDESELIGRQHNVIRHPDMPRAVFGLAWQALRQGEDFYGYVKNLCKDGGCYWVFAHIRPEFGEDGEIRGYRSVRRAPGGAAVASVAALYARMCEAERRVPAGEAVDAGLALLREDLAGRGQSYEQMIVSLGS